MPHEELAAIARRAEQRVGKVVRDKWTIDALLGVGGMAAVYAATHRNGKRVALKFIHPELLLSDGLRARFLREGHVANRVGHPGAVSVIDDDVAEDGAAFLVMELLDGENLEQRWNANGTLSCGDVLMIADQMLDVLAAAHGKDIIHRDLKPANVFLCTDGRVKILDFGIARLREISGGNTHPGQVTTMSSMGTPSFMPPEQARGRWEQVDARSDLWALGATMFALLTGRFVHVEETTNEQLLASMTKPAPKLREIASELPEEAAAVVDRALAFAPSDRFPDARAMQEAVRDAYKAIAGRDMTSRRRVFLPPQDADASGESPTLAAPSAPTLAASSVSSPGQPVKSVDALAPVARPSSWRGAMVLVGSGALVVAAIAFVTLRGARDDAPPTTPSTSATPASTSTSASMSTPTSVTMGGVPSAAPIDPPPPSPTPTIATTIATTSDTSKGAPKIVTKPLKNGLFVASSASAVPLASAAPSASSSSTVDIFGRRR